MCLRDADGTQSVSLVFSCTKEEKGEEGGKAFVTVESHKVSESKSALFFLLLLLLTYMKRPLFFFFLNMTFNRASPFTKSINRVIIYAELILRLLQSIQSHRRTRPAPPPILL